MRAMAIAIADSVTVSMLEAMMGIATSMRRLKEARVFTAWRERMAERRGTSRTSSKVSAVSGRSLIG